MAQRRMMSMHIIDSDAFMDMPHSSQNLYMHMLMRADDDGFVASPKKISRMIGANDDDIKVLIGKRFVIPFESGVCVIKHWRIHNYIQSDRYNATKYLEEKALLKVKDNGGYTLDTECIQNGYTGKVSIGKVSIDKKESSLSFLESTPDEVVTILSEKYQISPKGIKTKAYDLFLYCKQKAKVYKDYKSFLENALRKDAEQLRSKYPIAKVITPTKSDDLTPEQLQANLARIEKIKSGLLTKFKS